MNTILLDLRYSLRTLLKTPTFTVAAVLSLAIGIGTTAAVFSVVNALLLQPLPYKDPDRLTGNGEPERVGTIRMPPTSASSKLSVNN